MRHDRPQDIRSSTFSPLRGIATKDNCQEWALSKEREFPRLFYVAGASLASMPGRGIWTSI